MVLGEFAVSWKIHLLTKKLGYLAAAVRPTIANNSLAFNILNIFVIHRKIGNEKNDNKNQIFIKIETTTWFQLIYTIHYQSKAFINVLCNRTIRKSNDKLFRNKPNINTKTSNHFNSSDYYYSSGNKGFFGKLANSSDWKRIPSLPHELIFSQITSDHGGK